MVPYETFCITGKQIQARRRLLGLAPMIDTLMTRLFSIPVDRVDPVAIRKACFIAYKTMQIVNYFN